MTLKGGTAREEGTRTAEGGSKTQTTVAEWQLKSSVAQLLLARDVPRSTQPLSHALYQTIGINFSGFACSTYARPIKTCQLLERWLNWIFQELDAHLFSTERLSSRMSKKASSQTIDRTSSVGQGNRSRKKGLLAP